MSAEVAVNPDTGELLEHLEEQPPATLAEALEAIRERQTELSEWARALEAELRRRLKVQDRTVATFGPYEVTAKPINRSTWDVEIFEAELERLVADGTIKAGEVTEVMKRETSVRAGEANKLIARLDGEPKAALAAARSWREEMGKVLVKRTELELEAASGQAPPDLGPGNAEGSEPEAEPEPAESVQARPTPPTHPTTFDPEELFA